MYMVMMMGIWRVMRMECDVYRDDDGDLEGNEDGM